MEVEVVERTIVEICHKPEQKKQRYQETKTHEANISRQSRTTIKVGNLTWKLQEKYYEKDIWKS